MLSETILNEKSQEIIENSSYLDSIMEQIVAESTGQLDELMRDINEKIILVDSPPINLIEHYFAKLTNTLYFLCTGVEKLGVYDSISKLKAQETYNNSYLNYQSSNDGKPGAKKPTVKETEANAELESMHDKTLNDMYNRAYKIVKTKFDCASTMVSTLSKILSHRIQESQLLVETSGKTTLNEDVQF